jgi:small acid-soluble spore protein B (major beta-type SASP)
MNLSMDGYYNYCEEVNDMPNNSNNSNKLVVPSAQAAIDQMKYEIANEQGVTLGADATARQNGSVGGEITKRLVKQAQQQMSSQNQQ